ncbi:MAG: 3-phosphoshikimate 1-carboxyvinyltransferase [Eubacteriales bacterium]|nr:3-phosphoshikimate 1-carboxyvinyltransferase [Eubacteriales bacterium]
MVELRKVNKIKGEVTVPGDKSISHRGVMLGALGEGITEIEGFLTGADCLSTIDCFRNLGIETELSGTKVVVHGKGIYGLKKPDKILYTGNSGTTTRLLSGILAGQSFDSVITGDASICKRPMSRVVKPLSMMGADIKGEYCPLEIKGSALNAIKYNMPVASAQVKTAILLAGLYANGETEVVEIEKSRDHTERILSAMGADIIEDGLSVKVRKCDKLTGIHLSVPGDISSAAFFIAAASVMKGSEVLIKNVGVNPTRTGILDVARNMGADIKEINYRSENNEPVCDLLVRSADLKGVRIDGAIIPRLIDELPVIAVMALAAEGETVIADAAELKVKETNRITAVCTELKKSGADITETDDGMIIRGGRKLIGADFASYGDHRMAMSLAVLAQMTDGKCNIDDISCCAISYPEFFNDLYAMEDK